MRRRNVVLTRAKKGKHMIMNREIVVRERTERAIDSLLISESVCVSMNLFLSTNTKMQPDSVTHDRVTGGCLPRCSACHTRISSPSVPGQFPLPLVCIFITSCSVNDVETRVGVLRRVGLVTLDDDVTELLAPIAPACWTLMPCSYSAQRRLPQPLP